MTATSGADRIDNARDRFATHEIDHLLVTHLTNIRYLTGFSGSAATLVVGPHDAVLITDARYALQAPDEIERMGAPVEVIVAPGGGMPEALERLESATTIGFEAEHMTVAEFTMLEEKIAQPLVAVSGLVEVDRMIKDASEVDCIRRAAAIADAALAEVRELFTPGCSERRFALELDAAMGRLGADRPGFDTIVASGPNGARPHHQPGDREFELGDLVIVDFGAELDGYRSDMTRSFSIGAPSEQSAAILDAVRVAQQAGVDTVRPGVAIADVDAACRTSLADAGFGQYFTHGTGHGVGLDIHEAPMVSARATANLAPGHVITVEPGVYIPDFGGVRWEDTVLVTEAGVEPLTRSAKDPVVA